jgi:hypothetical protein
MIDFLFWFMIVTSWITNGIVIWQFALQLKYGPYELPRGLGNCALHFNGAFAVVVIVMAVVG